MISPWVKLSWKESNEQVSVVLVYINGKKALIACHRDVKSPLPRKVADNSINEQQMNNLDN
ncbi:hypothetical protein [Flagellimonas beolgyonensis]|uniref:hypothetical protein n=1 Tax=Flagellimonas beolgyonensis TaxID=864064 RepID=UPI003D6615DF